MKKTFLDNAVTLAEIFGEGGLDWFLGPEPSSSRCWVNPVGSADSHTYETTPKVSKAGSGMVPAHLLFPDNPWFAGFAEEDDSRDEAAMEGKPIPETTPKTCIGCALKRKTEAGSFLCLAGHTFRAGWDVAVQVEEDGSPKLRSSEEARENILSAIFRRDEGAVWAVVHLLGKDDWIGGIVEELLDCGTPFSLPLFSLHISRDEDLSEVAREHLIKVRCYPAKVALNAWEEWVASRPEVDPDGEEDVNRPSRDELATTHIRNLRRSPNINWSGGCRDKVKWSSFWKWFFDFEGRPISWAMGPNRTYCKLDPKTGKGFKEKATCRVSRDGWEAWKSALETEHTIRLLGLSNFDSHGKRVLVQPGLIHGVDQLLSDLGADLDYRLKFRIAIRKAAYGTVEEQEKINRVLVDSLTLLLLRQPENMIIRTAIDRLCSFYRNRQAKVANPDAGRKVGDWYKLYLKCTSKFEWARMNIWDFGKPGVDETTGRRCIVTWKTKAGKDNPRRVWSLVNHRLAAMENGEREGHVLFYDEKNRPDWTVIG